MNKRISTALLASGLVLGGIGTAQLASAQYGGDTDPAPAESSADAGSVDEGTVLEIQEETDTPEAETPDTETPEDGEGEGRRGRHCGGRLDTAAETIGIEVDALRAALDEGQTIAEVAEANGVDPQTVIDAMVDASDERLAEKAERIEDRVFGIGETGEDATA